jgi:mersacidin/lichenicidin family type 2 lantibiotic
MSPDQVVRAWKDVDYSASLSVESIPAHPVGRIDIADSALDASGGDAYSTEYFETAGCCQGFTQAGKCDFTAGFICTMWCFTIWMTTSSVCGT